MNLFGDELLLRIHITSDSMDSVTLEEVTQVTIALLEVVLMFLVAVIKVIHFLQRFWPSDDFTRLWYAAWSWPARFCLAQAQFAIGVG